MLFLLHVCIYIYIIYIQVKKPAFKIIKKIDDVGLNKDLKKYGSMKCSQNFHDQTKSLNPTYCFFFLSELTVSKINALLIIFNCLFLLRTSSYCIKNLLYILL